MHSFIVSVIASIGISYKSSGLIFCVCSTALYKIELNHQSVKPGRLIVSILALGDKWSRQKKVGAPVLMSRLVVGGGVFDEYGQRRAPAVIFNLKALPRTRMLPA
jgi:hypothetical protein